jgi:hypothetical protein
VISPSAYVAELAWDIAKNVVQYDRAVFDKCSRVEASDALAELAETVSALSPASVKGELNVFKGDILDQHWRLHKIFGNPGIAIKHLGEELWLAGCE